MACLAHYSTRLSTSTTMAGQLLVVVLLTHVEMVLVQFRDFEHEDFNGPSMAEFRAGLRIDVDVDDVSADPAPFVMPGDAVIDPDMSANDSDNSNGRGM